MNEGGTFEPSDKLIGIDEAHSVLTRLGLTGPQQDDALSGLTFPTPLGRLLVRLRTVGLDEDDLFNELGASP